MTTVLVRGEHRAVEDWLADRHRLGLDRHDEVWQGVHHVAPHADGRYEEVDAGRLLDVAMAVLTREVRWL